MLSVEEVIVYTDFLLPNTLFNMLMNLEAAFWVPDGNERMLLISISHNDNSNQL